MKTIEWHLRHHHQTMLARPTINRILLRSGQVTPAPSKRPKSCLAGAGRQGVRNAFEQQLVVRTMRVFSPPVGAS